MLFNIGDRVVADDDHVRYVGKNNIGTIIEVIESEHYYVIEWDKKGRHTYSSGNNINQWNMGYYMVHLYDGVVENTVSPHYKIIRKIRQMENRRKANGYAF